MTRVELRAKRKRFLVFIYADYYPSGGMQDCEGSFDTLEEAMIFLSENRSDTAEIFDRVDGIVVHSE